MNKYELVIFDWDGTLAKTLHLWLIGYREGLIEQKHTCPDEIIARDFFYEHDKAAAKYPDIDFEQLVLYARSYIKKHVDQLELYDGARGILELSSKRKLALVSSSPRHLLELGLEVHGLSKYFDFVIAGDDITKHKPDPEAFNQTMEFFSVSCEKTLIIGDAKTDILAGKASGVSTCFFAPESNKLFYNFDTTRTSLPDFEIDSLSDFSAIYLS